ncbi:hypothetical protein COM86_21720, partial [Priestia megaterium]
TGATGATGAAGTTGASGVRGASGATGAQFIPAYGYIYNNIGTLTPYIGGGPIVMPLTGPSNNVTPSSNGLTITVPGVYEIEYGISITLNNSQNALFFVRSIATALMIPGTEKSITNTTGGQIEVIVNSSTIANFNNNDLLVLVGFISSPINYRYPFLKINQIS